MAFGKVRLIQSRSAARPDPLEHWLEQERSQSADGILPQPDLPAPMPSGWWILPMLVMALPIWGFIIWALVAG